MEKLMQFGEHKIYKVSNEEMVDGNGRSLKKRDNMRFRTWRAADHSMAYEENREGDAYLYQRLSYRGDDKVYHVYGISMCGRGNIPMSSVLAAHETYRVAPSILKINKVSWGHYDEDEDALPVERSETYLYPEDRYIDKLGRSHVVTVISRDRDADRKEVFNAFDLHISYVGRTCKPARIEMRKANLVVIRHKVPTAYGRHGVEVSTLTHDVLAKFGIDSTQIIRPKYLLKAHGLLKPQTTR